MECFSYKGVCGIRESRCLKEELAWALNSFRLFVILNSYKAVSSLNNIACIALWSLVTHSNCVIIYYRPMLHGSAIR